MADADKHHGDWCKLVLFAEDGYDAIQQLLSYLNPNNEAVIQAHKKLTRMPIFMLQVASSGGSSQRLPLLNFDIPLEPYGRGFRLRLRCGNEVD
ncbi:1339_t:CDS:2 [Paraglomus occultum]|uniref:1339_t:CDS:1 n=1 Tax=Paraglomus occultum TaxID=144539 RepID=A0A9N9DB74_9GLOM|nr:1339_t:CDS:2 [Paraglomus occultum]